MGRLEFFLEVKSATEGFEFPSENQIKFHEDRCCVTYTLVLQVSSKTPGTE